jgi:hypothetical protein
MTASVQLGSVARCSAYGCKERAVWRPVLILKSPTGGTATVSLPVAVCESHRGKGRVVDALSATGVNVVERVLADLGFEIPDIDWNGSTIRYVAVT